MSGKIFWTIASITSIWLGVLFVSLFATDLITGSQQEHIPIASLITWISGAAATRTVLNLMTHIRGTPRHIANTWIGVGISIIAVWLGVTLVSLLVPEVKTGSDPTHIPLAAILAPIGGVMITGTISQFAERLSPSEIRYGALACPGCGKENPLASKFCLACGTELMKQAGTRFCKQCGAFTSSDARYCSSCGAKL